MKKGQMNKWIKNYGKEVVDTVKWLSFKLNSYEQNEFLTNFFTQLEKAQKKVKSFQNDHGFSSKKLNSDWAHETWAYIYPHKTGVDSINSHASFYDLADNLEYYQKLNVKVFYLLPFYSSPRKDGGYDISNYCKVDKKMGGDKAFDYFMAKALQHDMQVVIDFIPAHVSDQHPWFQKALKGEEKYLNYFLHTQNPPPSEVVKESLDVYRQYYHGDGSFWFKRLLLLPDSNNRHWIGHKLKTQEEIFFHSTFFSHQKDLNLQNAEVVGELLKVLASWVGRGVMGIRADAIHRWIKLPGSSGEHQPETFALAEYFNLFLKLINPTILFMPELVDVPQHAVRYYGEEMLVNQVWTPRIANALINFNKTGEILYAATSSNFSSLANHYKASRYLPVPRGSTEVIYTGVHHDEIYIGLLGAYYPDENHVKHIQWDFCDRVTKAEGVVYKEGNSAAATVADLMQHDKKRILSFYKFLFGHFGSVALFQGSEIGLTNNHQHLYEKTISYLHHRRDSHDLDENELEVLKEVEQILAEPALLKLPPAKLDRFPLFKKYFDGRLLHRNAILQTQVDQALKGENIIFNGLEKISAARDRSIALKKGGREEDLNTMRYDVGSFMRRYRTPSGETTEETAVLMNGTSVSVEVNIAKQDLTQHIDFKLWEIEQEKELPYILSYDHSYLTIQMKPYEALWLRVQHEK